MKKLLMWAFGVPVLVLSMVMVTFSGNPLLAEQATAIGR
jgi:hypothetical protein